MFEFPQIVFMALPMEAANSIQNTDGLNAQVRDFSKFTVPKTSIQQNIKASCFNQSFLDSKFFSQNPVIFRDHARVQSRQLIAGRM
jgi:hypothetical protein